MKRSISGKGIHNIIIHAHDICSHDMIHAHISHVVCVCVCYFPFAPTGVHCKKGQGPIVSATRPKGPGHSRPPFHYAFASETLTKEETGSWTKPAMAQVNIPRKPLGPEWTVVEASRETRIIGNRSGTLETRSCSLGTTARRGSVEGRRPGSDEGHARPKPRYEIQATGLSVSWTHAYTGEVPPPPNHREVGRVIRVIPDWESM